MGSSKRCAKHISHKIGAQSSKAKERRIGELLELLEMINKQKEKPAVI